MRAEPFCQHYGVCGGCKWQCLSYQDQIRYKQKQVYDNLTRIGKVELPEFMPILGSEKTMFYRNKLEFTFSNKRWLTEEEVKQDVKYDQMNAVGFHIPGAFDKVLAIEKCWLQDDISNQIRNAIRDFAYEHNYEFFDLRSQEGMLRNMMVRTSSTGELMVLLQCKITSDAELDKMKVLLQFVADKFLRLLHCFMSSIINAMILLAIWMLKFLRVMTISLRKWKGCALRSVRNLFIRQTQNRHIIFIR